MILLLDSSSCIFNLFSLSYNSVSIGFDDKIDNSAVTTFNCCNNSFFLASNSVLRFVTLVTFSRNTNNSALHETINDS